MRILAIDPGTEKSGWILHDLVTEQFVGGITNNEDLLEEIAEFNATDLAIEMVANYGMAVGRTTFETCVWIGRFIQWWSTSLKAEEDSVFMVPEKVDYERVFVYRREVKLHLCNSVRAKDTNVRQAILDLYPATGGGKTPQIGTKAAQGPLYGVKSHMWAALGVALTFAARRQSDRPAGAN